MEKIFTLKQQSIRLIVMAAIALLLCIFFWHQVVLVLQLLIGGWTIAFLFEPLSDRLERHMKHGSAVACTFFLIILVLLGAIFLLFPPITVQIRDLLGRLPETVNYIRGLFDNINAWLVERNLFRLQWPEPDLGALSGGITRVMNGTVNLAGSMVDALTRFGLMLMLSFYFLLDREKLLLILELLIPSVCRRLVLRMAAGVKRELKLYLRSQFTIAAIVGVLSVIGFAIIGVPSYLVMGVIVGVFNIIPYFGLFLGGIPAVLMSVSLGVSKALLTVAVLFIVQQLEGFVIAPRVMSGMTGLSAPLVLIAITVGGSLSGVMGMFFALPCVLIAKICIRVWIGRNEVIEKHLEM